MRAVRFHRVGGPDVLQLDDVPEPAPGPGEALLSVRAAGVNFADTHFRKGEYFVRPQLPQIAGMEAAGEIVAVGAGVTGLAVGDRVMALGANAYAERMIVRPNECYPMPMGLGFVEAAALPVQGITAAHVLGLCGRVAPGDRVLVHAGAGGVGSLAIQLAKALGASMVVATASSPAKRASCVQLGADVALDAGAPDFVERLKDATERKGVDVILEMIGGTEHYRRNLACLTPFGRIVVYGSASGDMKGVVEPIALMARNVTVAGYYLTPMLRRRELCAPALEDLARRVARGDVRVVLGRQYPLAEAAEAHRALTSRGTTGKLVLVP